MISRRKLIVGGATLLAAPAIVQRYSWAKPPPLLTADLAADLWLMKPPNQTVPAWFPVRINRSHWFATELLFSGIFNAHGAVPLWTNGFAIGNNGFKPSNQGQAGSRFGGPSLISGQEYDLAGSAFNMKFSGTSGSLLSHFSYSWAYNSGFSQVLATIEAPVGSNFLQINKFSDSNIYAGWGGSSDTRIVTSASFMGANDGGQPRTMGLSWTAAGGTVGYFNGGTFGSNGTAPNSSTSVFQTFTVNTQAGGIPWLAAGNAYDGIYGFHLFNRALTAGQHFEYWTDPCCGLEPDYSMMMAHNTTAAGRRGRTQVFP